jgi:hypothetical protein
MKVNGKEHLIEEIISYQVEDPNPDMEVYGWVIELKTKNIDFWVSYWTNKIYNSKTSAENAIIQIPKYDDEEYRIVPLYRLQGSSLRDFKLKKVLGEVKEKKPQELKAWKSLKDFEMYKNTHKTGSIFIQLENGRIIKSGQNEKTVNIWGVDFKNIKLKDETLFEEVQLKDEKWLHPHLLKEVKSLLKI